MVVLQIRVLETKKGEEKKIEDYLLKLEKEGKIQIPSKYKSWTIITEELPNKFVKDVMEKGL